ncbi:hypothetical protein MKZ38_008150 [Zalerion maritima]|uniref:Uncharacterized protein n=1 Tax=Zalerion maritima TaxID=339359 RepID=A0AAD5RI99_9PEZI|nr:hypothetical protein MKZ38_008150 [Zalerion maritima]
MMPDEPSSSAGARHLCPDLTAGPAGTERAAGWLLCGSLPKFDLTTRPRRAAGSRLVSTFLFDDWQALENFQQHASRQIRFGFTIFVSLMRLLWPKSYGVSFSLIPRRSCSRLVQPRIRIGRCTTKPSPQARIPQARIPQTRLALVSGQSTAQPYSVDCTDKLYNTGALWLADRRTDTWF